MPGATATKLECPRCGESVPSWQPVHVHCFVYRIRVVVWILAAAVALPVAIWGFRFASVAYERTRVSVAAAGIPADQQSSATSPLDATRSADTVTFRDPVQKKLAVTTQALAPAQVPAQTPALAARPPAAAAPLRAPATAPRQAAPPGLRVGDRWVTDVVDHQDARLNYRSERIVQSIDGGRVVTSVRTLKSNYTRTVEYDGQWSLLAARLPNGATTTYAPAIPYLQFPMSPGQRWQARVVETKADGTQRVHELRAVVEGWGPVSVPAGQFDALRVVLNDDIFEGGVLISQGQDVSWYVPEVRRSVKSEETSFSPNSGERRRRTIELVAYALL